MTVKKAPSQAQIEARKKFAEMARARAKAAKVKPKKNPLKKGRSPKVIAENIKKEVKKGRPVKQAAAIAFRKARESNPICYYVVTVNEAGKVSGYFDGAKVVTTKAAAASYHQQKVAAHIANLLAKSTNKTVGVLKDAPSGK